MSETEVEELGKRIDAGFIAMDSRFRSIEARLAGVEKKLEEGFDDMRLSLSRILKEEELTAPQATTCASQQRAIARPWPRR